MYFVYRIKNHKLQFITTSDDKPFEELLRPDIEPYNAHANGSVYAVVNSKTGDVRHFSLNMHPAITELN